MAAALLILVNVNKGARAQVYNVFEARHVPSPFRGRPALTVKRWM
jgi:hypothetical protein